jgi:hypothetical protein
MQASECDTLALIFDRANLDTARKLVQELENDAPKPHEAGWSKGVALFESVEHMRYLLMVADGPGRVIGCSPRVAIGADDATLRAILEHTDGILSGRTVKWIIKCEPEAKQLVRDVLRELTTPVEQWAPIFAKHSNGVDN